MPISLVSPGSQLAGRYNLVKELAAGGSAQVYLAVDTRYQREVAVKVLRPEVAGLIGAERFLREINTLAQLQHPNILPLYDSGMSGDLPFFVSPYISGKSLRDRLNEETSLPIEDVVRIVRDVAEAVDFAHAHGVIHRDIKPENVLLQADHAVLADFGIAKAIHEAAGEPLTANQLAIGTPAYMSPEQGAAEEHIGPRTDVYSLGVVTYEMLVGDPPFSGATPWAIQARKVVEPVPSLRKVRSTIDPAIETAVKRALRVTAADRWPSAGAFARALTAPIVSPPRASRRRAAVMGAVALFGLAAILFAWRRIVTSHVGSDPPRVVVSEFNNMTGDPSLDYIGITAVDWLTEGFQRTGVISGVATESAIRASRFVRGRSQSTDHDPILDLATESGADIVVTGRIYRSRDSLQYQIQVTDAKNRKLLGAIGPIATPMGDPIQGLVGARTRLMGLLAAQVDDRVGKFASGLPDPPTYEAYREFSLGLDRYIRSDFSGATPLFVAAYSRDTTFAAPLLFASISLSNQGRYREADSLLDRLSSRREQLTQFQQAWLDYRRAFLAGQRRAALSAVRALDAADPGGKATYNHAVEALENGYAEEAIATLKTLSPDRGAMRGWLPYYQVLGSAYHLVNRFSDELAVGEDARRRFPDRLYALLPSVRALGALGRTPALNQLLARATSLPPDPYGTSVPQLYLEAGDEISVHGEPEWARAFYLEALKAASDNAGMPVNREHLRRKAAAQGRLGQWEEAARTAETLARIDGTDPGSMGLLGTALAHTGRRAEARAVADALGNDRRPYLFGRAPVARARIGAALGEFDGAISDLDRGFNEGQEFDVWVHRDPDFDALRSVPRFQALVALKR
jgi:tRNA A-37 threonylcarbamoyl transferase component Bud32/tetratricopeptide (TPR) repeat protein/TolB-like protein